MKPIDTPTKRRDNIEDTLHVMAALQSQQRLERRLAESLACA